jgi:DNA-binding transcriptional regulator YdaS (Cro superfamily)
MQGENSRADGIRAAINQAIEIVGGLTRLGRACGVTKAVVWGWRDRASVPAEYAPVIEAATQGRVPCEHICPAVDWAIVRSRPVVPEQPAAQQVVG